MTKRSFSAKGFRAKEPLEIVHSDVCGPLNVQARGVTNTSSLSLTTILGTSMFTVDNQNNIYKFKALLPKDYYLIPGNDAKNLLSDQIMYM